MVVRVRTLRPTKAPNLIVARPQYEQQQQELFKQQLRLYFETLDNFTSGLMNPTGGQYINFPYGAFQDDTTQHDGSTTIPYAVRLNTTDYTNGISVQSRDVVAVGSIGPASTTMTITSITSGRFYPGMILSGTGVTSGTYVYLQLSSTETAVATPTFVSGGAPGVATVVLSSVTGIEERQFVSGTGVPANTRVIHVDTATNTVTLSANFTIQAAGTYSFLPWGYKGTYSVSPSQTVAAGTTITGTTDTKITVAQSGLYNVQFSFQFTNPDNAIHDIDIWFKVNDVTVDKSNSQFSINARKSAGNPSHLIAAMNFFLELQADDYFEIVWHTSNSAVYMEAIPTQTAPIRPSTPSAIVTVSFVSELP